MQTYDTVPMCGRQCVSQQMTQPRKIRTHVQTRETVMKQSPLTSWLRSCRSQQENSNAEHIKIASGQTEIRRLLEVR